MKNKKKYKIIITLLFAIIFSSTSSNFVLAQKSIDDNEEQKEEKVVDDDSNIDQPPTLEDYEPPEQEISDEGKIESPFEVNITVGTQSAWNKKVPLFVEITPKIDASRTEIRWDSAYGVDFEPKYDNFFPLAKGETKTYKVLVNPAQEGEYPVTVSVTDWGYGRNYISSDQISLTFNKDLLTEPRTDGYTFGVLMKYVTFLLIFVLFIAIAFFFGRYAIAWLKEWLKPPEY